MSAAVLPVGSGGPVEAQTESSMEDAVSSMGLSDDEIVSRLEQIQGEGRRVIVRTIALLIEVEARRVHFKVACASLFEFCTRRLGMSEGAAFRRITAARLVRRFPRLLDRIERGDIHLSSLTLLRLYLTDENYEELITEASRRSRRRLKELIARRFPRPDVPSGFRKLPNPRCFISSTAVQTPVGAGAVDNPAAVQMSSAGGSYADAASASAGEQPLEANHTLRASMSYFPNEEARAPRRPAPSSRPGTMDPLSEGRHRLQLTVTSQLRTKIEHAVDLMRHRNPYGDMAVVIEDAVDLLLAKLAKERLGQTTRGRNADASHDGDAGPRSKPGDAKPSGGARTAQRKRGVSKAVRAEVFARYGEQCAFVDAGGTRCESRAFLELDHIAPYARGGSNDADNLRPVCRAHNRFLAEQAYGATYVEHAIHLRRRKRKSENEPDGSAGAACGTRAGSTPPP